MNENVVLAPVASAAPLGVAKLSWAGLLGGMVVAVGVWLLLTVLGLAIGLSSFEPGDAIAHVKGWGIGTGIWSVAVSLIALFAGGLVASRTSGILDRSAGAIHGAVLWSLATVLSIALVGGAVNKAIGAAVSGTVLGVTVTSAGQETAPSSDPAMGPATDPARGQTGPAMGQAMGADMNDLIAPINERLRAEGKPAIAPARLRSILGAVTTSANRDGRIDHDVLVTSLAENTTLSRAAARDFAARIEAQSDTRAGSTDDLKRAAFSAADAVGKAMWWVFLGMLLGLAAAVLGATLGVRRAPRFGSAILPPAVPPVVTTREVIAHEVHPHEVHP